MKNEMKSPTKGGQAASGGTEQVKVKEKKNYTVWWVVGGCCLILVIMTLIGIGLFYFIYKASESGSNASPTPTSTSTSSVTPSATSASSSRTYSNSKYNFSFEVPAGWGEYQVEEGSDEWGSHFSVYVKTQDQSFDPNKPGWTRPITFGVYEKAKWDELQSDPYMMIAEQKITEANSYVYGYSHWQDCAEDLCSKINFQDIINTFKVK